MTSSLFGSKFLRAFFLHVSATSRSHTVFLGKYCGFKPDSTVQYHRPRRQRRGGKGKNKSVRLSHGTFRVQYPNRYVRCVPCLSAPYSVLCTTLFVNFFQMKNGLCYFLNYVQDLSGGPCCPLILSPLPLKTSVITTNMIIVDSFCPPQLTVSHSSCLDD